MLWAGLLASILLSMGVIAFHLLHIFYPSLHESLVQLLRRTAVKLLLIPKKIQPNQNSNSSFWKGGCIACVVCVVVMAFFSTACYPIAGLEVDSNEIETTYAAIAGMIGFSVLVGTLLSAVVVLLGVVFIFLSRFIVSQGFFGFIALTFSIGVGVTFILSSLPDMVWYAIAFSLGASCVIAGGSLSYLTTTLYNNNKQQHSEEGYELAPLRYDEDQNNSTHSQLPDYHSRNVQYASQVGVAVVCLVVSASAIGLIATLYTATTLTPSINVGYATFTAHPPPRVPHPVLPGPYDVQEWVYQRDGSTYLTPTTPSTLPLTVSLQAGAIDLSDLITFSTFRENYYGFSAAEVPLRGFLWTPIDKNRSQMIGCPLFLISAGNHQATQKSAKGYAYLCQHLASHGIACGSFDADFMNSVLIGAQQFEYPTSVRKGLDMLARGVLYLAHSKLLSDWTSDSAHPLAGLLDMTRVAYSGHSRSGEAAAIAAWALKGAAPYPIGDSPRFEIDAVRQRVSLRAIVAFAPTDATYLPGGHLVTLKDINYLTLAGTHDIDQANTFEALRQMNAVEFTLDPRMNSAASPREFMLKTAVHVYRANHGQWNTVWADSDIGPAGIWLIDRDVLLRGEEQRDIAKVLVTMFLNSSFSVNSPYRDALKDIRQISDWLPQTNFKQVYSDVNTLHVATFDGKGDASSSLYRCAGEGSLCNASNISLWEQKLRNKDTFLLQPDVSVYLTLFEQPRAKYPQQPIGSFSISFPIESASKWQLSPSTTLVFDLSTDFSTIVPTNPGQNDLNSSSPQVSVVARFAHGNSSSTTSQAIRLEGDRRLAPTLLMKYSKVGSFFEVGDNKIVMLQTYSIPFSEFIVSSAAETMHVEFTGLNFYLSCGSGPCTFILDNVGFRYE